MKYVRSLLLLPILFCCICALAQNEPKQAAQPSAQQTTPTPSAQVDVYHVSFNKAAPGKAAEVGQRLSTPDPKAPMPGHFVVLRHQEGDDWDYCVIEHVGTKATVDPAAMTPDPAFRELSAWHGDTFVSGPPWAEFVRAMGLGDGAAKKNAVYIVGVFRPASGHRDPLEQALKSTPAGAKVPTGAVLMQHLEGAPWTFLQITRYDSWQDLATDRSAAASDQTWNQLRDHVAFHHDTIADRIAPK